VTSAQTAARFASLRRQRLRLEARRDESLKQVNVLMMMLLDRLDAEPRRLKQLTSSIVLEPVRTDYDRVRHALGRLEDYGLARWTEAGYVRGLRHVQRTRGKLDGLAPWVRVHEAGEQ